MANRQSIDELFRDRLGKHEVTPPLRNWKIIQGGLPKPKPFYQSPLFLAGVAAIALIMGGIIGYWSSEQTHRTQTFQHQTTPYRYNNNSGQGTSTPFSTTQQQQFAPATDIQHPPVSDTDNSAATQSNVSNSSSSAPMFVQPKNAATEGATKKNTTTLPAVDMPLSEIKSKTNPATDYGLAMNTKNVLYDKRNTEATHIGLYSALSTISAIAIPHSDNIASKGNNGSLLEQQQNMSSATIMGQTAQTDVASTTKHAGNATTLLNTGASNEKAAAANDIYLEKLSSSGGILQVLAQAGKQRMETPLVSQNALLAAAAVPPTQLPNRNISCFSFGILGMANQTWILGKSASDPATIGELTPKFDMGHTYGAALTYNWSKNWGISAEVLSSKQGQTYARNIDGEWKTTQLNMSYVQIPLTVRYKYPHQSRLFNRQSACNIGMGLQYASLQRAEIPLDNLAIQNNILQKHNWGLVVDADYDLSLSKHLYLNAGVRGTLSRGSSSFALPWLNSTNTVLVGLKGGLYYKF